VRAISVNAQLSNVEHIMDTQHKQAPARVDDPEIVWGAAAIGQVINRTPRQVHHMLQSGHIHAARRCGNRYFADKAGLRAQFCSSTRPVIS
jgi:hypothetical protein